MRMLKKGLVYAKGKGFKNLQAAEQSKGMHLSSDCCSVWRIPFSKKNIYIYMLVYNRNLPIHTHTLYIKYIYIYTHDDERSKRHCMNTCWLTVYIGLKWGGELRFFFYDISFAEFVFPVFCSAAQSDKQIPRVVQRSQ